MGDVEKGAPSGIEGFIKQVGQYKELIVIVSSLVGGVFFVRDYFATKQDLKVLQCQADNGIALVQSKVQAEQIKKNIISVQSDIATLKPAKKTNTQNATTIDNALANLNLDLEKQKNDLADEYKTQKTSVDNLKPGVCEAEVNKK